MPSVTCFEANGQYSKFERYVICLAFKILMSFSFLSALILILDVCCVTRWGPVDTGQLDTVVQQFE